MVARNSDASPLDRLPALADRRQRANETADHRVTERATDTCATSTPRGTGFDVLGGFVTADIAVLIGTD
ncbi:hypothetical protein GCM10029978_012540 [Actinoallomurus acanthiterrae]